MLFKVIITSVLSHFLDFYKLQTYGKAEQCFEEEIVDDNTVHHSGSLFVASTVKQHHPQQKDTDLLRARDSFAVCDFNNNDIATNNNDSTTVEADLPDLLDSDSSSVKTKSKRPNLKLKRKSDCSLKDLDDSDSSLSDDFSTKKKPSRSKATKSPSSAKVNLKKSSDGLIDQHSNINPNNNEEDILVSF